MTALGLFQDLNKSRKHGFRIFVVVVVASIFILFNMQTASAFPANQCAANRFGADLGCTAQDVSITGIAVAAGSPTKCVAGGIVNLDLDVTVNFAVPDRWDVGIFLATDALLPTLLVANGGSTNCSVSTLPTPANPPPVPYLPFIDLDGPTDLCGDGNGTLNGTGSGLLRVPAVPLKCQSVPLSSGKLFIPFVVSWDNTSTPPGAICYTNADPVPNTKSKCNSPDGTVATQVQNATIPMIVLPTITKTDGLATITAGDTVNYSVAITNNTGAALVDTIFKDPAVTNLTANSVSCAVTSGTATCPGAASLTVAYMQGGGITIPDMANGSVVTFTVNATLSASASAGTITNIASVTTQGEFNEASDTDNVRAKIGVAKVFTPFSILVNETSVLSITLTNTNLVATAGTAFTDTYPANLVNAAAPGVTNTCGGTVTAAAGGGSLSLSGGVIPAAGSCVITVNVTSAVQAFYTNSTGAITTTNGYSGNSVDGYLSVGVSSLLTSTKTWMDLNGGEADPGDVIQYTITIVEVAGVDATGVTVTDTVPATLNSLTVVTCPPGATCGFVGQLLTVSNIDIPANGSRTIVFDATIVAGTASGTHIDNCALIINPGGGGAAPCASTIIVSPSAAPGFGNKRLYLYDATSAPAYKLSRTIPTGLVGTVTVTKGSSQVWALNPALATALTISPTVGEPIPAKIYLSADVASVSRTVTVSLVCSGGGTIFSKTLIFDGGVNEPYLLVGTPTLVNFRLPLTGDQLCAAGQTWNLTVANATTGGGTKNIVVWPMSGAGNSYVSLPSKNIINVDSVNACTVPCDATCANACAAPVTYMPGEAVYVRAKVSDPFGAYDINANPPATIPQITIIDSTPTTVVSAAPMTEKVSAATASAKWFEYTYTPIPVSGPSGFWSISVTALEGAEGTVSDSGVDAFLVSVMPSLLIMKNVQTFSDPINGTTNPKAIPGAVMLYTVYVRNSGYGSVDNNTTVIKDAILANVEMCVSNICNNPPVTFACSAVPSCGLTFAYGTAVTYSSTPGGGAPFNYTPAPDANGYDPLVTGVRINPTGVFAGSGVAPYPDFSIYFKVRVK